MSIFAYIIAAVLLFVFLVYQFYPWFKLRAAQGKPAPSLADIPGLAEEHPERVLLYFMSPSCGMCRDCTPVIDELAAARDDVVRIDASTAPQIAQRFRVLGTPTFVVVNAGVVEKVKLGAMSRAGIMALLEKD